MLTVVTYTIEILVNPDGSITALVANEAIKPGLLKQILCWKAEHCTDQYVITRLRQKTVPTGYKYTTWQPGIVCVKIYHTQIITMYIVIRANVRLV